jgi:hypothetical protein
MCAGRPSWVSLFEPPVEPALLICCRNSPSGANFRI